MSYFFSWLEEVNLSVNVNNWDNIRLHQRCNETALSSCLKQLTTNSISMCSQTKQMQQIITCRNWVPQYTDSAWLRFDYQVSNIKTHYYTGYILDQASYIVLNERLIRIQTKPEIKCIYCIRWVKCVIIYRITWKRV